MEQIIKSEEKKLMKYYKKLNREFEKKVCPKCKGTDLQKKRMCGKLFGFKDLGCTFVTKKIILKMKPYNQALVKMVIAKEIKKRIQGGTE